MGQEGDRASSAPDAERVPGLDLLRAIAIIAVMLYHMPGTAIPDYLQPVHTFGWMGVDLFFVLSGYLIGSQLLKQCRSGARPSLRRFYGRRSLRVLPAFLVVLALYLFVPAIREYPAMRPAWRFLTFSMNLGLVYDTGGAFSHAWSLCVEEYFYLVFPLLVLWMIRRSSVSGIACLFMVIGAAEISVRLWSWYALVATSVPGEQRTAYFEYIYYPTYTRLDGLLVGVVLSSIRLFRPRWWDFALRRSHGLALAGVGLISCAAALCADQVSALSAGGGFTLVSIGCGCVLASSAGTNTLWSSVAIPGARGMATLAYCLYLTHKAVIGIDRAIFAEWMDMPSFGRFLLYGSTSLATAWLLHICVERPFLLLRDGKLGSLIGSAGMDGSPAAESPH